MSRARITILACLLAALPPAARADIRFTASVDTDSIPRDGVVHFTLTLQAPEQSLPNPTLPDLGAFEVFSSGRAQNVSYVDGRVTTSIAYNYALVPRGPGNYTIGEAKVTIDGKEYTTQPIAIVVTKEGAGSVTQQQRQQPPPETPDREKPGGKREGIFITTSLDKDTALVNEPVTFIFRFYRAQRLLSSPEYNRPEFPGFWVEELSPQRRYRRTIDGVEYDVTELRTMLFPTDAGVKTIEPARLKIAIPNRSRGSALDPFGRDIFGLIGGEDRVLQSDPLSLIVLAPPARGRPENWSGLVGRFRMKSSVSAREVAVGDPITVTVTIEGEGNIKSIARPQFDSIPDFRTFSAGTSETVSKEGYRIGGMKSFEEVFVPQRAGVYALPVFSLCYYDLNSQRYATLTSDTITVTVTGASTDFSLPSLRLQPDELSDLAADVRFLKTDGTDLRTVAGPGLFGPAFWAGHLVPLCGLLAFVGWRRRILRDQANPASRRRRLAYRSALQRLRNGESARVSTADVASALEQFFSDRYNCAARGLRRNDMRDLLAKDRVPESTLNEYMDLLDWCDRSRYVPADSDGAPSELITRAISLLAEFEQSR
ncbi:MAG TPA: BatD family protein [candidate division Zixibacteria bacterium]|jgi:hypothetical protein